MKRDLTSTRNTSRHPRLHTSLPQVVSKNIASKVSCFDPWDSATRFLRYYVLASSSWTPVLSEPGAGVGRDDARHSRGGTMDPNPTVHHRDDVLSALRPTDVNLCRFCGRPIQLSHRQTKKFCGDLCRSRFHYARRREEQADLKRHLNEAAEALRAAQAALD